MTAIDPSTLPDFADAADLIRLHAKRAPSRPALVLDERALDYAALDALMDRIAGALQRDGLAPGHVIALCAATSIEYAAVFLGALRAGIAVAPLAPGNTSGSTQMMLSDSDAKLLFTDATVDVGQGGPPRIALDDSAAGRTFADWLAGAPAARPRGDRPAVAVQHHLFLGHHRRAQGHRAVARHALGPREARARFGYGPDAVTLLSTPLYSNTTLVVFFPTAGLRRHGRADVQVRRAAYLELAQRQRVTHTMLVPVQYQRIMARPDFGQYDLSSFHTSSAPVRRFPPPSRPTCWRAGPVRLVEFYGMTEGGGTCILEAHLHPDKLHTVGRPAPGHDIRLIDEAGREVPPGEAGEVVGQLAGHDEGLPQPARPRARPSGSTPRASASSAPAISAASTPTASWPCSTAART